MLASTFATLHELAPGRIALGVGSGDSSLRTMGLKPTKLADLEAAVADLRTLLRGEEVVEPRTGAPYHLKYLAEPLELPVYVAASAPRITRLAGRIADGVILLVGTDPTFVENALATLEEGAREAGRTLADVHVVLWTPTAVAADARRAATSCARTWRAS